MKTVYSEQHLHHAPAREIACGRETGYFEKPERIAYILKSLESNKLNDILPPGDFPAAALFGLHDPAYIHFLRHAHAEWARRGLEGDVFAGAYNVQHPGAPAPRCIEGAAGFYTGDGTVPITATSWDAIESSARVARTAQALVSGGEQAAFALCRPPGHHASRATASGYCFVNNAAVAAQGFLDSGARRVALLDVDYHHGNGTQDIFYDRDDVLFLSLHADPHDDYPYFLGHADEKGRGAGEGYNVNYPLPPGTGWAQYTEALDAAAGRIAAHAPDALVVSLGVDTFKDDPISHFRLESADYLKMGARLARLGLPTLFVMEGGYAVEAVGVNVTNVLTGFLDAGKR